MKSEVLNRLGTLILFLVVFYSCNKDGSSINRISINRNGILLKVNDSGTLTVSVNPSNYNAGKLKWISNNPDITIVNKYGVITAVKPGVALIIASTVDGKVKDTCVVTVVKITNYTTSDGLLSNYVKTIYIDSLGNTWFGTVNGVSKFDGINWTSFTESDGLASNAVNHIVFDEQKKLWFCTVGGVTKFDGTSWTTYTTNDGLASNLVYTMTTDNQGNKWFGTYNGLSKFDGINWTTYTTSNGLLGYFNLVFGLITDKKSSNVWALTNVGLSIYNGNSWTGYSTNSSLGSAFYGIFIDRYNNKWLATINGIFKFDGTNWTKPIKDTENKIFFAHDILFDNQDNIWFTTSNGIYKYDGKNISSFENDNFQMLNKTEINQIVIDKNENIWIAKTYEGVFKLETK
jgi:ligand-binding sensor domain-containing protein